MGRDDISNDPAGLLHEESITTNLSDKKQLSLVKGLHNQQATIMGSDDMSNDPPALLHEESIITTSRDDKQPSLVKRVRFGSGSLDILDLEEYSKLMHVEDASQMEETGKAINSSELRFPSDLIVILDLDNCLTHFVHDGKSKSDGEDKISGPAYIFRPGLEGFLRHVMSRYETHVFTAARSQHADFVLDALVHIVGLPFAGRWYREHCTMKEYANRPNYVKNIGALELGSLAKIVLVDNNAFSFLANPRNGIPIRDFKGDCNDKSLVSLVKLLSDLEQVEDVRTLLDKRFQVEAACDEYERFPNFRFCDVMFYRQTERHQL